MRGGRKKKDYCVKSNERRRNTRGSKSVNWSGERNSCKRSPLEYEDILLYYFFSIFLYQLVIIKFAMYPGRENEAKGRITQRKGGSKAKSCQ